MKKVTQEPTTLVTAEQAIEGLTARVKELEMIQQKGGMTVPKMRDIARRLRMARAKLGQFLPPPEKPRKRRSVMTPAAYLDKVAALLHAR